MRSMKKAAALALALFLCLSLSVGAWATQEGTLTGGSITIDNAVVGQTYNAYQILYLESYNATSGAYSYKANSAWETFLKSEAIKDVYVSFDDQGYVTWVSALTCTEEHEHSNSCYTSADAAAFAKLAQTYATTTKAEGGVMVSTDATATATTTEVKFESLKLGYYLVDSTLGVLCSLDTTNPTVTIKEKNGVPTVDKKVKEDSTELWGKTNDADINQTVEFQGIITLPAGSENVAFYDKMSAGLTLNATSIKVYTDAYMTTELAASNYTLDTTAVEGENGYTFKITFTQTYLDGLTAETKLYVYYTAAVNENAVVGLPGNPNDNWLSYGDKNNTKSTPKSKTITYTWDVDVLKYANGKESDVLAGAQFVLVKTVTEKSTEGVTSTTKDYFAVVENGKLTGWTAEGVEPETGAAANKTYATVLTTGSDGKIEIDGLDADTYYLREIKAPAGYNKLAEDTKIEISATKGEGDTLTYTTVVAKVNNQSGTELPSTGGMGTTIFYVAGGVLAVLAVVLLVTRKRMGTEN